MLILSEFVYNVKYFNECSVCSFFVNKGNEENNFSNIRTF